MRLYYDQISGDALWTYDGPVESAPGGTFIEIVDAPASLNGLQVINGAAVYNDLSTLKSDAIARVNERAGRVRRTFITDLPGQEMLYLEKLREAVDYMAETPEPATLAAYPLLASEVGPGLTAPTAYQLAQIWLYLSGQWKAAAGQIETARLGAVYAIEAATSPAEITAIEAAYNGAMP